MMAFLFRKPSALHAQSGRGRNSAERPFSQPHMARDLGQSNKLHREGREGYG